MQRYRIAAEVSVILPILNFVLTAPIAVQEIHKARRDEVVLAEDAAAMLKNWRKLEVVDLSPRVPMDAMASPEHESLSEASMSSGYYPSPPLSPDSSDSASHYLWLLDRPLRLRPPAPLDESAAPHPSEPGSTEIPLSELQGFALEDIPSSPGSPPARWQGLIDPLPLPHPHPPHPFPPHPRPSSSGSSVLPQSLQLMWSNWPPTETHFRPHTFSPSHNSESGGSMPSLESISGGSEPSGDPEGLASLHHSASGGSRPSLKSISGGSEPSDEPEGLASLYHSASVGSMPSLESISGGSEPSDEPEGLASLHHSASVGSMLSLKSMSGGSGPLDHQMPEESVPSHHSISVTSDESPPPPSLPPTKTLPDDSEFFDKNMMKKLKIFAGVAIIGGIIASIAGSQIIRREHKDTSAKYFA